MSLKPVPRKPVSQPRAAAEPAAALPARAATPRGEAMYALVRELYPICRSITGDGVRQTLARLKKEIPLEVHEVPSGTKVFDWTVPREWNIRDAYVKNSSGDRIIDFRSHNLHVVNYSIPVRGRMSLALGPTVLGGAEGRRVPGLSLAGRW